MTCPACRSAFVAVVTSSPIRRLHCGSCSHAWVDADVGDTAPPPPTERSTTRIAGPRAWLEDVGRTIAVALGPGSGVARWGDVEVVNTDARGAKGAG